MAFGSSSTLQQEDGVAAVAASSGSAVGGGGTSGGGPEIETLNASDGNVTEPLPDPSTTEQVLYVRVDDTASNTVTLEEPDGNDIYIFAETNRPTYEMDPRERVYLVSDGSQWYVEDFQGSGVLTIDASSGNVTEPLPPPSDGTTLIVFRTNDSSNTATVETADTSTQEIRFPEGENTPSTTLDPSQSLLLVADGSHWYVEDGTAQKAEIGAFRPGALTSGSIVLSHVVAHEWQINSVIITVGTPPGSGYDFDVDVGGTVITVTLPGGQSLMTADIGESIPAESEVRVTAKGNDTNIEDIRTTLDVS